MFERIEKRNQEVTKMEDENWAKRKIDIHRGSGDRTREEKRVGNAYLDCDYEE